jgi:hypothetical protein
MRVRPTLSVVPDVDDEPRVVAFDAYLGRRRRRVLANVGERFADDVVGGHLDAGGGRSAIATVSCTGTGDRAASDSRATSSPWLERTAG